MQSIHQLAKGAVGYEPGRHTKVLWVCAEGFGAAVLLWSIEVPHETSIQRDRATPR
jgi:hypothetical protein